MNRRRELLKQISGGGGLPEGFTKCKYIGSSGVSTGQYVNTLVYPTNTTGMYVKLGQMYMGTATDANFIGCRISGGTRYMVNIVGSGDTVNVGYGFNSYVKTSTTISKADTHEYRLNLYNNREFCVDDTAYAISDTLTASMSFFAVFGQNVSGRTDYNNFTYKYNVYAFQMTEGTELIRDFVPCLDANGVPCFYDKITEQCFYNKGYGTFIYEVK